MPREENRTFESIRVIVRNYSRDDPGDREEARIQLQLSKDWQFAWVGPAVGGAVVIVQGTAESRGQTKRFRP
jgi:hypothetical protein